jgi:hypothetical protein
MIKSGKLILFTLLVLALFGCAESESGGSGSVVPLRAEGLKVPIAWVTEENDCFTLNWDDSNADQYRVLYWRGNEAPQEHITTNTAYTIPTCGVIYSVIVEAYDELGNSLFSQPVTTDVL